jgi:hypothetical protein
MYSLEKLTNPSCWNAVRVNRDDLDNQESALAISPKKVLAINPVVQ